MGDVITLSGMVGCVQCHLNSHTVSNYPDYLKEDHSTDNNLHSNQAQYKRTYFLYCFSKCFVSFWLYSGERERGVEAKRGTEGSAGVCRGADCLPGWSDCRPSGRAAATH